MLQLREIGQKSHFYNEDHIFYEVKNSSFSTYTKHLSLKINTIILIFLATFCFLDNFTFSSKNLNLIQTLQISLKEHVIFV